MGALETYDPKPQLRSAQWLLKKEKGLPKRRGKPFGFPLTTCYESSLKGEKMKPQIARAVNSSKCQRAVVVLPTLSAFQEQTPKRLRDLGFDAPFQGFMALQRTNPSAALQARIRITSGPQIDPGIVWAEFSAIDIQLMHQ